jgi:hypothetical protein
MNKESKFYYRDGTTSEKRDFSKTLHREDGPAVEWANGDRDWFINGKYHRVDGPALEMVGVGGEWYIDDRLHRIGGPAVDIPNRLLSWYVDGKLHRLDGPATWWYDGERTWNIDGAEYTEEEFNKIIKEANQIDTFMKLIDPRWWVREMGEKELHEQGK